MYLYLSFFKPEDLENGKYFARGKYLNEIKDRYPNYTELNKETIKGIIGFLKPKGYANLKPYILKVLKVDVSENNLNIDFKLEKELGTTNDFLNKQIYKYSMTNNLIDRETGYPPTLFILNKEDFDNIRKGTINTRKITNNTQKIDEFKIKNDWKGIVDLFEPLENLKNHSSWDNADELSEIAFACNRLGSLQNGKERDKSHLQFIKKYREFCIDIYKRCIELQPKSFRHYSGVAYRYYLNAMEVSNPRGRKDGKASEEIENSLIWLNKSLELYQDNIGDLSRKGYLLLDKKLDNMKFSNDDWTRDFFEEFDETQQEGIACLKKVVQLYENLDDENRKRRHKNDYIKSLYRLSKFSLKKVKSSWNEYVCGKLSNNNVQFNYSKDDYNTILYAKEQIEKCIYILTGCSINETDKIRKKLINQRFWNGSPMDMLYQIANVYFEMYFIKKNIGNDIDKSEQYRNCCEKYLKEAISIGIEMKRSQLSNRSTWHISEKLARYFIINENYMEAIKAVEKARDSYAKNTYAIALILEGTEKGIDLGKQILKENINDKYNKAEALTLSLLLYMYQINDEDEDFVRLKHRKKNILDKSKKLLPILGVREVEGAL